MFRFDGSFRGGSLLYVNVGWCGYCTKARPIMDQVSLMLGHGVPVYDVDGDVWREYLVSRLGEFAPKSYPTILFIGRNGDVIPYTGERAVDEIVAGEVGGARVVADLIAGLADAGGAFRFMWTHQLVRSVAADQSVTQRREA